MTKHMRSNSPPFALFAVGYLFLALNIRVNGYELLLPNVLGYALICSACWSERGRNAIYRIAAIVAGVLTLYGVRDFFGGAYPETFKDIGWLAWPVLPLEASLALLISSLVWQEARSRKQLGIAALAVATLPILLTCLVVNPLMPRDTNSERLAAILVYTVPAIYLTLLAALASKRLQ